MTRTQARRHRDVRLCFASPRRRLRRSRRGLRRRASLAAEGGRLGRFSCPKSRVHILTTSGKTRDVEACEQHATYTGMDGDWRMTARSGGDSRGSGPDGDEGGPPGVAPAQPAPVIGPADPTGTPSLPPSSLASQPAPPASQPSAGCGRQAALIEALPELGSRPASAD